LQFPLAVFIHIDATRLNIESPEPYELGTLFPLFGWLVVALYLSNRSNVNDRSTSKLTIETSAREEANQTVDRFRVQFARAGNFPTQLACACTANPQLLIAVVIVPQILLMAGLVFSPVIGRIYLPVVVVFAFLVVLESVRYTDVKVTIDRTANKLQASFNPTNTYLQRWYPEVSVDPSSVDAVQFAHIGPIVLARFETNRPFVAYSVAFPAEHLATAVSGLTDIGVPIATDDDEKPNAPDRVVTVAIRWLYLLPVLFSLVVIPAAILISQPFDIGVTGATVIFGLATVILTFLHFLESRRTIVSTDRNGR
jgi:hypothetical protein